MDTVVDFKPFGTALVSFCVLDILVRDNRTIIKNYGSYKNERMSLEKPLGIHQARSLSDLHERKCLNFFQKNHHALQMGLIQVEIRIRRS